MVEPIRGTFINPAHSGFFVQGLAKEYPMLVPLPFPLAGGKEGRHVDPEHHHFRRADEDFGQS